MYLYSYELPIKTIEFGDLQGFLEFIQPKLIESIKNNLEILEMQNKFYMFDILPNVNYTYTNKSTEPSSHEFHITLESTLNKTLNTILKYNDSNKRIALKIFQIVSEYFKNYYQYIKILIEQQHLEKKQEYLNQLLSAYQIMNSEGSRLQILQIQSQILNNKNELLQLQKQKNETIHKFEMLLQKPIDQICILEFPIPEPKYNLQHEYDLWSEQIKIQSPVDISLSYGFNTQKFTFTVNCSLINILNIGNYFTFGSIKRKKLRIKNNQIFKSYLKYLSIKTNIAQEYQKKTQEMVNVIEEQIQNIEKSINYNKSKIDLYYKYINLIDHQNQHYIAFLDEIYTQLEMLTNYIVAFLFQKL